MVVTATFSFFFFNDPATTEIYPLSLHDALPISGVRGRRRDADRPRRRRRDRRPRAARAARRDAEGRVDAGAPRRRRGARVRSEEHTSELQSPCNLVCRLLLEKKKRHNRHKPLVSTTATQTVVVADCWATRRPRSTSMFTRRYASTEYVQYFC